MSHQTLTSRLNYLDAVRAFALLLGIVFHASMSFTPIFMGWAVMDISTSPIVSLFLLVSHSFRMELFFLIAGFFSHMTLSRKGTRAFVHSRLTRIVAPFLVGWFVLKPLIVSGWVMGGQSMRGEVDVMLGLRTGFQTLMELPQGLFTGSHLWFLYYLTLVTGIALGIRGGRRIAPRFHAASMARLDSAIRRLVESRFCWWTLATPTAICLWFMNTWGMDTPDKSLIPHAPVLMVYGAFFGFGWALNRQNGLIETFATLSWGRVVVSLLSILGSAALIRFQGEPGLPYSGWIRAAFVFLYAIMMWSLVSISIGLFRKFFDRPNRIVRYVADASYWLYLVHLPIVVWLQVPFAEVHALWIVKLSAISALTVGISLVLYDLFVRASWVGGVLNGRKRPRCLFGWVDRLSRSPDKSLRLPAATQDSGSGPSSV